jgi:hypothetical protein
MSFEKLTAEQAKQAIYRRHPAEGQINGDIVPGQWTVLKEYLDIDLLAISAYKTPQANQVKGINYPWIGYEIKVSRSDMRSELLKPNKRSKAVGLCNQFYFVVPKGMLNEEELIYQEPNWEAKDFIREQCPNMCSKQKLKIWSNKDQKYIWKRSKYSLAFYNQVPLTIYGENIYSIIDQRKISQGDYEYPRKSQSAICHLCKGKGYLQKSIVELQAPTLWIPEDVGLIEVTSKSSKIIKKAPISSSNRLSRLTDQQLNNLIRWISVRPDPRHKDIVANLAAKRKNKQL